MPTHRATVKNIFFIRQESKITSLRSICSIAQLMISMTAIRFFSGHGIHRHRPGFLRADAVFFYRPRLSESHLQR
ncbi:hypothetical protein XENTR_v10007585 [Xenopus tropicalis]|nr:hypothetical protein XENTR_v10007585 [Xenopus tropicalis]